MGLSNLVSRNLNSFGGPFWFLQLWALLYFQNLCPRPLPLPKNEVLGLCLTPLSPFDLPVDVLFKYFYDLLLKPESHFFFYHRQSGGLAWFASLPLLREIWASFLVPRDLHLGIVFTYFCEKSGVEWYGPSQVARQFGLVQMVPLLPLTSLNSDLSSRIDLTPFHPQMVEIAEKNYREQLARFQYVIGVLELDAGHNASFSIWLEYYAASQFDLSSDQMIDILRLPRSGSRIPLARFQNPAALGVHLAEVGQPSTSLAASSNSFPEVLDAPESHAQVSYRVLSSV